MCRCEPLRFVIQTLNGTEGRTRTDTVSPPPDFESGASTNSATPAQASIITINGRETMGFVNYFSGRDSFFVMNREIILFMRHNSVIK